MEKYGTLEISKEYLDKNQLEDWIQLFLRNDGHNVALADGLLKEERCYTGIVDFDLNLLENIKAGAPEYLIRENDIEYFFAIVNEMNEALGSWNPPPLIIEYRVDGSFHVCDGRHRLEMYRQKNVKTVPAIVWTTGEEHFVKLQESIKC